MRIKSFALLNVSSPRLSYFKSPNFLVQGINLVTVAKSLFEDLIISKRFSGRHAVVSAYELSSENVTSAGALPFLHHSNF